MVNNMMSRIYLIGICCLIFIVGCDHQDETRKEKAISSLQEKIDFLCKKIDYLENQLKKNEHFPSGEGTVIFSPDTTRYYQIAKTPLGEFPIFLKEPPKKSNGYKAVIMIGNPHSFIINNFEIEASWPAEFVNNKSNSSTDPKFEEKTFSLSNQLFPAIWNEVVIHIPPVEYENIDYMFINFKPKNLSFEGDTRKTLEKLKAIELIKSISK